MFIRVIVCLILFSFVSVCQATSDVPTRTYADLSYVASPDDAGLQKLNLIVPIKTQPTSLLIWIGGGAWSYVDRNQEMDLAQKIANTSVAVASVGHRLSSAIWHDPTLTTGVQHPAHMQDIAMAVSWLWEHSDTYNIDRTRIYIGGFSSGAHLAALLVSDPEYLQAHNLSVDNIQGVIAIGGAYDIVDYHRAFLEGGRPALATEHVEAVFGPDKNTMIAASPMTYVESFDTPLLLMSDRNTYTYTKLYEEALVEAETQDLTVVHARNFGHGPLWRHLSQAKESPHRDMIVSFVNGSFSDVK